jgi:hypothetical protein
MNAQRSGGQADRRHANSHHALLTNIWTADVQALERGIGEFAVPPAQHYHVSLFELKGDSKLHVNVTHKQETEPVDGWSGPGLSGNGFVRSRTFESTTTAEILRSICDMVFAARA